MNSFKAIIFKAWLQWTEHIIRTDSSRILRPLLYSELLQGRGSQLRQTLQTLLRHLKVNVFHSLAPKASEGDGEGQVRLMHSHITDRCHL